MKGTELLRMPCKGPMLTHFVTMAAMASALIAGIYANCVVGHFSHSEIFSA